MVTKRKHEQEETANKINTRLDFKIYFQIQHATPHPEHAKPTGGVVMMAKKRRRRRADGAKPAPAAAGTPPPKTAAAASPGPKQDKQDVDEDGDEDAGVALPPMPSELGVGAVMAAQVRHEDIAKKPCIVGALQRHRTVMDDDRVT